MAYATADGVDCRFHKGNRPNSAAFGLALVCREVRGTFSHIPVVEAQRFAYAATSEEQERHDPAYLFTARRNQVVSFALGQPA
jgi:hypothetical protein